MSATAFRWYSLASALGMAAGETWFVVTTDKYAPLWLDDYFAVIAMLISVYLWRHAYGPALLLASWTFVLGNLYAMLFTRLEPVNPPDRPWILLSVLVIWALISSVAALLSMIKRSRNQAIENPAPAPM